ncbi:DUF917 domain-containing protein [Mesobacillus harenae]|uniref:DUF917 domain-containing protein n=1 Tax=Mesobacillus harenae TaxID=2213203 RepID=UPI001580AC6A|nr:DUF917 domain-containing protein [Mesobacillus harenae]
MRYLDTEEIENIAIGAAVLGTGGGGDPYIGKMMAIQAIKKYGKVKMITIDELEDDDLVVPVSTIGAPTVGIEKVASEEELTASLDMLEKVLGKKAKAIMPIEIGGSNSLIPVAAAAKKGIPVLDADAMGRAFPEAQMVTYHLDGHSPGAVTMSDEKGNTLLMYPVDGQWSERFARAITIQMGGSAKMCDYALEGIHVKKSVIPNTLTLAEDIGKIIRGSRKNGLNPVKELLNKMQGYQLFQGKAIDIRRRIQDGFTRGEALLEGIRDDKDRKLRLFFQNEHLLALDEDTNEPVAITPDLIAVLDLETGAPITTEGMKYGARVVVVAFPCDAKWRTPKGIETAGPSYFGYPYEYQPVEQLAEKRKGCLA